MEDTVLVIKLAVEQKKEEPKGGLFANTSASKPSGLFAGCKNKQVFFNN